MRRQPAKWIAENPDAYKKGVRSFWLNAFSSPWTPWEKIVLKFLDAKNDPQRLKVVYNSAAERQTGCDCPYKAQGPPDLRGPSAFVPARLCLVVQYLDVEIDLAGICAGGSLSANG